MVKLEWQFVQARMGCQQTGRVEEVELRSSHELHIKTLCKWIFSTLLLQSARTCIYFINQSVVCRCALYNLMSFPITSEWLPPGHPEDPLCYVQPGVHPHLHLAVSSFHRVSKALLSPFNASLTLRLLRSVCWPTPTGKQSKAHATDCTTGWVNGNAWKILEIITLYKARMVANTML